jgi:hypothetical protein
MDMSNQNKLEKELDDMFTLIDKIICRENAEHVAINEGGDCNGSDGNDGRLESYPSTAD